MKIRFIPMYHQSSHLVDGFYKGDTTIKSGSSYEFLSISFYYYIKNFSIYLGSDKFLIMLQEMPHNSLEYIHELIIDFLYIKI